ncbi:hypothetical protein F5984_26060 [Rudanella paleaurantiibacter]|uniref:Uncharacterized protein n=1 Tax=Rudanella paleaurantiibacter TaxID=2614655 RepID=A0A7J5TS45_9BACT|nr:hypothetical protein [Rudanella paleaurantiibacter]KAB7725507.1 hypothetical protein F5984_26060 [Rudanella paleaurantiibacter]
MIFSEEEIHELKTIAPNLSVAQEGGYTYILICGLLLPDGCQPAVADALLCSLPREGYNSRLFFSEQIAGGPTLNWNGNIRVLGRNWYAISWQTQPGLRLAEILSVHLKAFR